MNVDLFAAMEELHLARSDVLAAREHITAAKVLDQHGHRSDGWSRNAVRLIDRAKLELDAARRHLTDEKS